MTKLEERVDCTMCRHYRMQWCDIHRHEYPHDGHNCPAFNLDYTIEDGEVYDLPTE